MPSRLKEKVPWQNLQVLVWYKLWSPSHSPSAYSGERVRGKLAVEVLPFLDLART